AALWPLKHRRLPGRREMRLFAHAMRNMLPARFRNVLVPPPCVLPLNFPAPVDPYEIWVANNTWNVARRERALRDLNRLPRRPLLSVIVPVYNIDEVWLDAAVRSVTSQIYPDWELCLADDASTKPHVAPLLKRLAASDDRIRVRFLRENGNISVATNAAAEMARGEFLVLLDQDDELTPDCLLELAKAMTAAPDVDVIYSDHDKISPDGKRYAAEFKPDWSPELLLSYMYFSHVFAIRRELYWQAGGCRRGYEG